jgi:hypothetical protein
LYLAPREPKQKQKLKIKALNLHFKEFP